MKHFILITAALLLACASMNAQTASDFHFKNGSYWQNGVKLSPEQLYSVIGENAFHNSYKPAKGLRTAGIVVLSVGGATTATGLGLLTYSVIRAGGEDPSAANDAVLTIPGVVFTGVGAAVTIVGGVLLGVGNSRLRKIKPASNGAGLAITF